MTAPPIPTPYVLALPIVDELADEATDLGHPAVHRALGHAEEASLMAIQWDGTGQHADRNAWLCVASAAYHEASVQLSAEEGSPAQRRISPQFMLALIANADRACALGGRGDIAISYWVSHLDRWADAPVDPTPAGLASVELLFRDLHELVSRYERLEEMTEGLDMMALSYAKTSMDGQINGVRRALAVLLGFVPDEESDREGKVDQAYQGWLAQR